MITIILWIVLCVVTYLHPDALSVPAAAASTIGLTFITAFIDGLLVTRWRGKPKAADAPVETSYPNGLREVVFGRCIDGPIRHYRASYLPGGDMFDLYTRYLNVDDALDTKVSYFSPVEARILHNALRKYLGIKEPEPQLQPEDDITLRPLASVKAAHPGKLYLVRFPDRKQFICDYADTTEFGRLVYAAIGKSPTIYELPEAP